jgi:hypothetical protein
MGKMNQYVSAALVALRQSDKNKAMELLKQAIAANQKDIDAWLVLSTLVDHPERKRQCLNRVLTLEPANKIAREEMLKLDRAAMGSAPTPRASSLPQEKPVQVSAPQPAASATTQWSELSKSSPAQNFMPPISTPTQPQAFSQPAISRKSIEKPRVFRYPIFILIATYSFALILGCSSVFALQDISALLFISILFFVTLGSVWVVSAKVEISEKGIIASRMFGLSMAQAEWGEIKQIKTTATGQALELITQKGSSFKVSSQVSGYSEIVQFLREKRPDLFGMAASTLPEGQTQYGGNEIKVSNLTPAFTGTKVFSKSFLRQFGSYFLTVPLFLVCIFTVFNDKENMIVALIIGVACLAMMITPFFAIGTVKVEGNKITVESFFEEKSLNARQIKEIKMKSVRSRSTVHHFVVINADKKYSLGGFSEGAEIIYGFLLNWWNAYRNQ